DWQVFQETVERRRLEVSAAVSLTYLAERLQCPVPAEVLEWLTRRAKRRPTSFATGLLLARPKDSLSRPLNVARGTMKAWRSRGEQTHGGTNSLSATRRAAGLRNSHVEKAEQTVFQTTITPGDREAQTAWQGIVDVTLALPAMEQPRRIEFELNTERRHVA